MPRRSRKRKSKYVTKRGLPYQLQKHAEKKFFEHEFASAVFSNPPSYSTSVFEMTQISQGTGNKARIGNEVQMTGLFYKFAIKSKATNSSWFRIVMYTPRIIGDVSLPCTLIADQIDPDAHIVWSDKIVALANIQGGGSGIIQYKKRFKPYLKVQWDGGSSLLDITRGQVLMLMIAEDVNVVEVNGYCRSYWTDI